MKYLFAATTAVLITACAAIAHDGNVDRDVVTDYDFSGFDKVDISGVYTVEIREGDRFSVRTEATEDSAKWSEVKLKGDTLVLGKRKKKMSFKHDDEHHGHGVHAYVTMPRLVDLDASGVTSGTISAFSGGNIVIDASGVTNLVLSGECSTLNIDASGVADIDAKDLKCSAVSADASGVSKLEVYAAASLKADSSGMSKIGVHGNPPDKDIEKSRMSKVTMR